MKTRKTKRCRACGRVRKIADFHCRSKAVDGLQGECKKCKRAYARAYVRQNRDVMVARTRDWVKANPVRAKASSRRYRLRSQYGLTESQYGLLIQKCKGCCEICGKKPKKLHVDHCHKTGIVRGLLCQSCNQALGFFRDNPNLLKAAIKYLRIAHEAGKNRLRF